MAYDAIIIGAGHNGLAAAVHLAAKGWKTAVFERGPVAGGAVKTAELTLPGFRHDTYAMNLSMFAGSPFFAAHKDGLIRHGLGFVPAADSFATAFPDGTWLGVNSNLDVTSARIAALSGKDAAAWRAMVADFARDAPHIFGILGAPMPSFAMLKTLWDLARAKGWAGLGGLAQLLLAAPRDFLDRHFESEKLKAMMAVWGLHLDFPPDAAGGALFPYLESMANQSFGMVIGQGGADTMIKALTGYLKELGGEIHLGAPVTGITRRPRANGITLADGRTFEARRGLIANVHPQLVFDHLVKDHGKGDAAYRAGLQAFKPGPGTMMIHYALDHLPDWTAGEALKSFAYVHLAPDMAAMTQAFAEAKAGLLPKAPALVVGQPTALDSSRAPPDKHILWVQVRVLPSNIKGDAAGEISGVVWDGVKDAYANRVDDLISSYAPGFKNTVLARTVLSPTDLERDNPNLIGGDSLAGSHHLDQNFMFRPVFGWSRYKTPVDGLYVVGASTWPGGGTGAGSGFMLAKMLAGA